MVIADEDAWIREIFDIQPHPIASGAIAQVHLATDRRTGDLIALKLKKIGIDQLIGLDLRLFSAAARILARVPQIRSIPIKELSKDISDKLYEQLDFEKEALNIEIFRSWNFFPKRIRFPTVVCRPSKNILAMSFETNLTPIDQSNCENQHEVIKDCMRSIFEMIFFFGIVHCDIHPGNLQLNQYSQLLYLDFGLVSRMEAATMGNFREFFLSVSLGKGDIAANIIVNTAISVPEIFDIDKFRFDVSKLISSYSRLTAEKFSLTTFVSNLYLIQRSHGVYGTPEFFWPIYALFCIEGLVRKQHPKLDFQRMAMDYIIERRFGAAPSIER
nr:AarF/UbiB family protein [Mesorhizobium silamurunense]